MGGALALAAAFFLEKSATTFEAEAAPEEAGAERVAPVKLSGLPKISETASLAGAVAAAKVAIG